MSNDLPQPTIDSELNKILEQMYFELEGVHTDQIDGGTAVSKTAQAITNLIAQEANKARLQELEQFTHSEGSIHILAEKVSYQPANHDPVHSWPIINGKVIIISQDYVKDRKAELLRLLTADKEQNNG